MKLLNLSGAFNIILPLNAIRKSGQHIGSKEQRCVAQSGTQVVVDNLYALPLRSDFKKCCLSGTIAGTGNFSFSSVTFASNPVIPDLVNTMGLIQTELFSSRHDS
jgi:hypothetical protein